MLLHVDGIKFKCKPTGQEIGGIKARFTKSASVKDLTAEQLAKALTAGRTVQPGVTPYSEESRAKGKRGTCDEDFSRQTVFMNDVDNKNKTAAVETPEHIAAVLAEHGLKAAFMYETFNSTKENMRFRYAVVCCEEITDRAERDRIQGALIAMSPQSDTDCINADRIFFGTDKGLIEEYTDFTAVCSKADLLAFAEIYRMPEKETIAEPKEVKAKKYGESIPTGSRHTTLVSFAGAVLKKYGVTEKAFEAYTQQTAKCTEPLPDDEISAIWRDACKHYETEICTKPDYIPPQEYVAQDFAQSLIPTDFTDVGQANLLAAIYGSGMKYTPATKWIVYNGQVWEENELTAQGLAQDLTEKQLKLARQLVEKAQREENNAKEAGDKEASAEAKDRLRFARSYQSFVLDERHSSRIAAALRETMPKLQVPVTELDKDPFLLNTPGGTVDLRTGKMRKHDPNDYCTKITAVTPGTEGAELFAETLQRISCNDPDLARYHQDIAGMCLVGKVFEETLITAYGTGGNGKSTLYNLQYRCLGSYAGMVSSEVLIASNKNKQPEIAELRGKRLIIAAELEEGRRLDTAAVKHICSIDPIRGEKKYKDPFDFYPSHNVVLYTNHLPKVGTIDDGTWDRLIVVPFNARLRGMKNEIKNYAEYLFERAGGAVLAWMIEGAKRFIANGYRIDPPECVRRATDEYRAVNDWLNNFLSECCEANPNYSIMSSDLYSRYKEHCDAVMDYTRNPTDFKKAMEKAGYCYKRTKRGQEVQGIVLKTLDFQEIDEPTPWDNEIMTLTG